MKFKTLLIRFVLIFLLLSGTAYSEPFVVLEYRGSNNSFSDIDSDHPFLIDENFSSKHKVMKNETLTDIILKYYGFKYFNKDILSLSIVHFNKHAFVRKNPNYLFANKVLYLPSLKEIKNLVLKLPKKKGESGNDFDRSKQIYFFGG